MTQPQRKRRDPARRTACLAAAVSLLTVYPSPSFAQHDLRDRGEPRSTVDLTLDNHDDAQLRVAMFNIRDLRMQEITDHSSERMSRIIELVQLVRPDVLVVQEIEYDGVVTLDGEERVPSRAGGVLAERFAEQLEPRDVDLPLAIPGGDATATVRIETAPIRYAAFTWPSNTGVHSGLDLDRNGDVTDDWGHRGYGGDCLGYGEFPGQYAMTLLVRESFLDRGGAVLSDHVRTFAKLRWADMPNALLPKGQGERVPAGEPWFTDDMLELVRLSSKSHWDVPIRMPEGDVLHLLISHPTPPVFDGPENRNGRRNHDEIRFWAEYLGAGDTNDSTWIVDDDGNVGGIDTQLNTTDATGAHRDSNTLIIGDLNADPSDADRELNPVRRWLFDSGLVPAAEQMGPASSTSVDGLDASDTATFGKRVDYILPGRGLQTTAAGHLRSVADVTAVHRASRASESGTRSARAPWTIRGVRYSKDAFQAAFPSDHTLIWRQVRVRPDGAHLR